MSVYPKHFAWTVVLLSILLSGCWEGGFTETDLENMKKQIKEQYEKNENVKVLDIVMLKESSKKAAGFVKLQLPLLGEINKTCSATMEESGNRYIWRCE
jgi:hypothetical protein